jgi:hypothetical protein
MSFIPCYSFFGVLLVVAGCGSVKRPFDDAAIAPLDAEEIDAPVVQTPPTPARELVNAAGRLTGATFTFDIEIGHPIGQQLVSGVTYTLQGNAAVKP